jgi:hypothetical protein
MNQLKTYCYKSGFIAHKCKLLMTSHGRSDKNDVICDLYYKPITIVNDDCRIVNMLETSLTDDARVIIYDRRMFIVQATDFILGSTLCLQVPRLFSKPIYV